MTENPTADTLVAQRAHTFAVHQWLAAPLHERGYYWGRVEAAWREARACGVTSQCHTAASNLLRFNNKLKGTK